MSFQDTTPSPVRDGGGPGPAPPSTWPGAPPEGNSYYGHPIIKEPTWTWEIPVYFVTGGVSGMSSGLSFAARLSGHEMLARRAQLGAFAMIAVSPPLLISDLGRPERFYNMLRVLKPSSPMSVGSWVLAATGGATSLATLGTLTGRLPRLSFLASGAAALLGLPLSTYTAVLIANTSVPVWHEARHQLPFVFAASSSAGAGALSTLLAPHAASGPARRLALIGTSLEIVSTMAMERHLGELAEPLRRGQARRTFWAAKALAGAGVVTIASAGRRSPAAARLGAALVLGSSMATRWSIFRAGFESARDPKYTVEPQRRRLRAAAARADERP